MTQKARKILQALRRNYPFRLSDASRRDRILSDFNRENLDDVGPVGGEQGMKVLEEMNEFGDQFEAHIETLKPNVTPR